MSPTLAEILRDGQLLTGPSLPQRKSCRKEKFKLLSSLAALAVEIVSGDAQLKLARDVKKYAAILRDENPDHFGFFAALPSLLSTEAALAELKYALGVPKADGVILFTRYRD